MANRNFANAKIWTGHVYPVLLDTNFIVDSSAPFGIRDLKGPYVKNVLMNSASAAPGAPIFGAASSYELLGASTITNTGASIVTGNVALSPGTALVGFPPGTIIGTTQVANATALNVKNAAQAAYTFLQTQPAGTAENDLTGLTLPPGTYTSATSMTLAPSGNGTLTLDAGGDPDAVWIFQIGSTLTTGAGGFGVISVINGGSTNNVFWQVGSSATINITPGSQFFGNIIAQTSITVTGGGQVNGRLFALDGAVTFSAATFATLPAGGGGTGPAAGTIVVQLDDNYNRYYIAGMMVQSPLSGIPIAIDNAELTIGTAYVITTVGTSTDAAWHAVGLPIGLTPTVGQAFIASTTGPGPNTSTSSVETTAPNGSGADTIETVGDTSAALAPNGLSGQLFGGQLIFQTRDYSGFIAAPADGSTISLSMYLGNSSVLIGGE